MKTWLTFAAIAEAAAGLALLLLPSWVGRLLLGTELSGVAVPIGRITGIALIALGIACWPGRTPLCGMLTYSALATAFLASLGIRGHWVGPLLWPAVALHAVMAVLLGRAWYRARKETSHSHTPPSSQI